MHTEIIELLHKNAAFLGESKVLLDNFYNSTKDGMSIETAQEVYGEAIESFLERYKKEFDE